MINPISDGQPITYDLLNEIIAEVNRVSANTSDDVKQDITVYGRGIGRVEGDPIGIATGIVDITIPKNSDVPPVEFNFPSGVTFDTTPYFVATIEDPRAGTSGAGVQKATVTILNLTKSSAKVKIKLVSNLTNIATTLKVHYIAIGPTANA